MERSEKMEFVNINESNLTDSEIDIINNKVRGILVKDDKVLVANYGGIINPDDPDNVTAYQIVVIKIPIGIEDYTESEKKDLIDQQLSMRMVNFLICHNLIE